MMPRLGEKYQLEIDVTSKPNSEYLTDEYFALDLPVAPAVMVGDKIVVEGTDINDYDLECSICSQLELPKPKRKGILGRMLGS